MVNRLALERKALLRLLSKCTSVDSKSTEDPRNFTNAPEVITPIKKTSGNLKVYDLFGGGG